jgi:hypothetical protein
VSYGRWRWLAARGCRRDSRERHWWRELHLAKWQAKQLFRDGSGTAQRTFHNHAVRKYRCKASQITFDDTGALKRIAAATVCYDDDDILGRTDGHAIEIACVDMTHAEIVGTLIHEAMHDWWISTTGVPAEQ